MGARLLLLCCSAALCAQAQPKPDDLLQRVRRKLADTVGRLPRYTCTQTVERAQYEPDAKRPVPSCGELVSQIGNGQWKMRVSTSDRLRLDVAVAGNREMYSWVGENRFDSRSLTDLVADGAISTGSFGAFLMSIFTGNAASFSPAGEKTVDGRQLVEFAFRIPLEKSQYSFGGGGTRVMTAYGGTFLVDPNTAELVHLAIRTEGLASETRACEAATTLDYGHVRLNATEFLLPSAVRLEIVDTNGTDSINRSVFTECHEFVGVSTVTFEAPPQTAPTAAKTAPASQAFALPPGIQFKVALAQDVDSGKAAAGDPIKAKVVGAIHDRSHRLLVPSGAAVAGRIVEIRRYYAPTPSLLVGIKLETVSVGGTLHPLEAHAVPVERPLPAGRLTRSASLRGFVGILRSVRDPGTAVLGFRDVQPDYVIGKGQESSWVTAGHEQAVPGLNAAAREAGPTLPPPSDTPAATTPGAPIPGWRLAGSVPQCYQVGVDRETRHGGGASGTIRSVTPNCLGFGTLMQTFQAQEFRERRVRLSAWVKTRDAGRASLWMRVDDDDGAVLAFDNMDRRSKRGTTGWHKEEIVLDVPHRAASINFGVLLAEHGQAWVDDMMFEVVDKKVKSTPMPVAQAAGRSDPNAHRNRANLPASPENLDFER